MLAYMYAYKQKQLLGATKLVKTMIDAYSDISFMKFLWVCYTDS